MPLLSCIVTTHNEGALALTSLRSLLGQGFRDIEVIVIDDGSTDDTAALVAGLDDPRIRLIRQANDGLSAARNKALEQVRGAWTCFLDADDSRPGWALGAIADVLMRETPDLLFCRGMLCGLRDAPEPFYDDARFDAIAALCAVPGAAYGPVTPAHPQAGAIRALAQLIEPQSANKVVRTGLIRAAGLRFPDTHFYEDIFFHSTALAAARRLSFLHTPCFTYYRRYQRAQITAGSDARRFDIIAVTRMTLQVLERQPAFGDPLYRAAVVAACLRLLAWCGHEVSHQHRPQFRQMTAAMLRLVDPRWLELPDPLPEPLAGALAGMPGGPLELRRELEEMRHAG